MTLHFMPRGFSIVELLIVISVLGILSAIGVGGWGAVRDWSENQTRETELSQWKNTFNLYKSRFKTYPSPSADGTYCIGDNFPSNKCGDTTGTAFSEDTTLNTQLSRVTTLPKNDHPLVNNRYLGPYAVYTATTIVLTGVFKGTSCPTGTTRDSASPSGISNCRVTLTR